VPRAWPDDRRTYNEQQSIIRRRRTGSESRVRAILRCLARAASDEKWLFQRVAPSDGPGRWTGGKVGGDSGVRAKIAELGATDGHVACANAAIPPPMLPVTLDVAGWFADLARRAIILRLVAGHAISAQPAGLLAAVDRRHLAQHRQAIVRYLEAPAETF
jgi:hypothetical protein